MQAMQMVTALTTLPQTATEDGPMLSNADHSSTTKAISRLLQIPMSIL